MRRLAIFWVLSVLATTANAATLTWSATPASNLWSNGANWVGGFSPSPGDDLVFPATSTIQSTTNDLAAGIAINSITFNGNGYRLSGNAITLGRNGSGDSITCTSAMAPGSDAISLPITLTAEGLLVPVVGGCTLTLSGAISGAGDLSGSDLSTGAGTLVLSGECSYTGSTGGGDFITLIVNGTLSGTSEVGPGGNGFILGGRGSILSPVELPIAGDHIAPGQGLSSGVLSTGSVTFDPATYLYVKLNGTTVGAQYDQLNVNGTVSISTLSYLSGSFGFVPANGTQFTIIKNNGGSPVSGNFQFLPEGATFGPSNITFQISYVGGSGHDVVLTVISPWVPDSLAVDAAGNGVLEPGELVTIQPTWTNSSGSSAHLTGATTNFTGPAGPTYSNLASSGDYGTMADGATTQCSTCYTVEVTGTRPQQHWDATIDETVTPSSTSEPWVLHVGESFPDVPTSQQFYKFIENLFHNGITGGCGGGNYCPGGPTTRAQMAVFLLKGEHGSGYVPPPCAGTFPDVSCPSQFADWIEQLHAEGITAGCGGGMYCPTNPVTRGQMAPFLLKAQHGGSYVPPACSATVFTDVPCPGAQFVDYINQLSAEGITGGCGSGDYCPGNPNTRGQMAVFLVKTFGLMLYKP